MKAARPASLLRELGFLADSPLVHYADMYFGQYADYGLAVAIAVALPFLRGALDQFLFKVCGITPSQECFSLEQRCEMLQGLFSCMHGGVRRRIFAPSK